jgi:hypothetical protein
MLDGMNVWYEARLLEEGVEDLQNLKTANWLDLILNTRIPAGRLVDWVDQAHLILHVAPPTKGDRADTLDVLRKYGVRTATDLEAAVYAEPSPSNGHAPANRPTLARLLNLKPSSDGRNTGLQDDGAPSVLPSILRSFAAEPALRNVRRWKSQFQPVTSANGLMAQQVGVQTIDKEGL